MLRKYLWTAALILLPAIHSICQEKESEDTCLLVSAECIGQGFGNFYLYYKISELSFEIKKGDTLEYDVFLYHNQPELKGGVDIELRGGGGLRNSGARDQEDVSAYGEAILDDADNSWYHRVIDLSGLAGQWTERWDIQFEGNKTGVYVQFIDNIIVTHKDGTQTAIYKNGKPSTAAIDVKEGYSKEVKLSVIPRAKVKDRGDLKGLIENELKLLKYCIVADQQREELEYVGKVMEREKQSDLAKLVKESLADMPAPEKFKGSLEDYTATLRKFTDRLSPVYPVMQKYTGHLVGHGHIDFQWLWQWPETIQICKDTFGQAVKFMEKFKDFTYSQSSAGLYVATQENHPELFKKMQEFVKKGQWEIVGGRWCEGDTNIISAESHARHFLYAQRYFRENFGVTAKVGWEPDTFGHTWAMPQLLRLAGIDSYYFCRAGKKKPLFYWEGLDGSRVLAFEESAIEGGWYIGDVTNRQLYEMTEFGDATGSRDMLWVYGVGNHGGGPTLENINTACEWQKKNYLPTTKFSTAGAFFDALKKSELKNIPVVRDELNSVFEGYYTTHGDIKRLNRTLESLLIQAETISTIAATCGYKYPRQELLAGWRNLLWNHHHDTIGGTAVHASYDLSKEKFASAIESMRNIIGESAKAISSNIKDAKGGVFVFNTLGWARDAIVTANARDDLGDGNIYAVAPSGETSPVQRTKEGDLIFLARNLPPFGYRLYKFENHPEGEKAAVRIDGSKISTARFDIAIDPATTTVTEIFDKKLQRQIISGSANDLKVYWEAPHGMSAWEIGNFTKVQELAPSGKPEVIESGPVRARIRVKRQYDASTITQDTIVYGDIDLVEFALYVDWKQKGTPRNGGPFLKTNFTFNMDKPTARYSIPFGDIERTMNGHEVPALQWADISANDWGVALLNDCKHGHSAKNQTLTLSLVRSSYEPDPQPDIGEHLIRYALYPHAASTHSAPVAQRGFEFNNPPLAVWVKESSGELPHEKSFLDIAGALPTALKTSEDGDDWVVRFYESTGQKSTASIKDVGEAEEVNLIEDKLGELNGSSIPLRGYEIKTVKLKKRAK